MACYSTIQTALDTGKFNVEILLRALKTSGWPDARVAGKEVLFGANSYMAGRLTIAEGRYGASARDVEATVRQAYTREAIATSARRHGLKVEIDEKERGVLRLRTDGRTA